MEQSSSQHQFLQVVCVVLMMAALIGVVAAYVTFSDVQNLQTEVAQAKADVEILRRKTVQLNQQIDTLKKTMGYPLNEVGDVDSLGTDTVVGKVQSDVNRLAGSLPEPTLRNALIELSTRLRELTRERDALKAQLESLRPVTAPQTRSNAKDN